MLRVARGVSDDRNLIDEIIENIRDVASPVDSHLVQDGEGVKATVCPSTMSHLLLSSSREAAVGLRLHTAFIS